MRSSYGSPPRTGSKLTHVCFALADKRITPARGEKTQANPIHLSLKPAHPRERGADQIPNMT